MTNITWLMRQCMAAECPACYETITQEQNAFALHCGHVCCSSCLNNWAEGSMGKNEPCPACQYLPVPEEFARPVLLRSAGAANPRSRAVVNLDDAIRNGNGLKALVNGMSDAENLTAHELQTMLDEALKVHEAMKELCGLRELQEVMSEISIHLGAIMDNVPHFKDKLDVTERQLKEHKLVVKKLQQTLGQKEERVRKLEATLRDQKQSYEANLKNAEAVIDLLRRCDKVELEGNYCADGKRSEDELERPGKAIAEPSTAVDRIRVPVIEATAKLSRKISLENTSDAVSKEGPAILLPEYAPTVARPISKTEATLLPERPFKQTTFEKPKTEGRVMTVASESGPPVPKEPPRAVKAGISRLLEELSKGAPEVGGSRQTQHRYNLRSLEKPSTTSLTTQGLQSPIKVKPRAEPSQPTPSWTGLLNRKDVSRDCAMAFILYHNSLPGVHKVVIDVSPSVPGSKKHRAVANLDGKQVAASAKNAKIARRKCAAELCSILRRADPAKWEQFVRSPAARKFCI